MSGVPFSLQAADMLHSSRFVERDEVMCINLRTELHVGARTAVCISAASIDIFPTDLMVLEL